MAANKLFMMSWIAAIPAGFMVFFAVMGIISEAKTPLKAVMAIAAIVGACLAAAPLAFLIFSGKKKKAAPAAAASAAAPAAAAAAAAPASEEIETIEEAEEASGEADVFEAAESDDELAFDDVEESEEEK